MVALDDGGVAGAGLDDVGVDGALDQDSPPAPIFLASASKTRMNSSPMILRLCSGSVTPASLDRKQLLGVHPDKVDVPLLEGGLHLVALVEAHEAVVHKHAGELIAHRLRQQRRRHGGVHAAAEGQQHLAVAHLLPDAERMAVSL